MLLHRSKLRKFGWLQGTRVWYKFQRQIIRKGLDMGMGRQGETMGKIAIMLAPDACAGEAENFDDY